MRWTPGGSGRNIEDRRGMGGGGGFGLGKGMGLGGMVLLLVLSLVTGRNFLGGGGGAPATQTEAGGAVAVDESPEEAKRREFVTFVLNDAQEVWTKLLPQHMNTPYREAKLVLFRDVVQSGCGTAQSATGPFYCPLDERAYIDLSFYDELQQRFGANGDFAQAYVLAHEIGHHVQTVTGTSQRVRELQERNPNAANQLSVRLELQADCYAGVWGASTSNRGILEQGDIEEGLNAAAAIGDDRISKMSGRTISPESFTHGTSAQRVQWFRRGLESGDPRSCDSFAGAF
jgi:predicted metalloprotease